MCVCVCVCVCVCAKLLYWHMCYACTAHIMYMCNSCAHITTTFPHPAPFSVLVTAYTLYIYLKHGVLKLLFIVDANSFTFRAHTHTMRSYF